MKKTLLLAATLAFGTLQAHAECSPPQGMGAIPDGNTATVEELVAAKKALAQYDSDVKSYGACLDGAAQLEIEALTPKATEATQKKAVQIKNEAAHKQNAEIDKLSAAAAKLNEQIRAYKARASKG